ncbi:MAG: VgrG-related protein [Anaerolineales bacterium]|nr:VgrG-related protein [Anaerolineales bacterium]MCB8951966.1 VgrG-related protein [Ardenticatenales bacterium]
MPESQPLASRIYVEVEGSELPADVFSNLLEVTVDQHAHLPAMFTARLADRDLSLLDGGPFDLAKAVKIEAAREDGEKVTLFEGEITALEPAFGEGMVAELVVRGYDKLHRLFRETKSRAFVNKKDSDLAREMAQAAGLQAEVDSTATVYDHLYQHNQSDLAFLMQRAWRIGYECFVEGGKLYFRQPPRGGAALTLHWGDDLQSFMPRMTLAEQVDEVIVKGWDAEQQQAIVGRAQATDGRLYPRIEESRSGAEWAGQFGQGKLVIVNQPVVSQAEADALAAARLNELSGAFVEADGVAFRRPEIKAGQLVDLQALGQRFSGTYLVTSATHVYAPEGLTTHFCVRGTRTGMLADQLGAGDAGISWPGIVTAIVTNVDDPQNWGRVKLKFPWMADDAESTWARVVGIGAGPEAGWYVMPAVADEVVVAFEHGDFDRPFVIGGLWNGQHAPPPEHVAGGDQPLVRVWRSRGGHTIATYDNRDNKVEVKSAGGHTVTLDDANKKLIISSGGGLTLTLDDNGRKIVLDGSGDVEINAGSNLKLTATMNMDLEANGQVTIKGAVINLN